MERNGVRDGESKKQAFPTFQLGCSCKRTKVYLSSSYKNKSLEVGVFEEDSHIKVCWSPSLSISIERTSKSYRNLPHPLKATI